MDFEIHEPARPEDLAERINHALPVGVRFDAVRDIRGDLPALGDAVRAARYRVDCGGGLDLERVLSEYRARGPVRVERVRKNGKLRHFDLTEELLDLGPLDAETLRMTLALHNDGASLRPEEALKEIFTELPPGLRLVREELLVDWRGRLVDPLLAASASRNHATRTAR
jgi:hypothetical protein